MLSDSGLGTVNYMGTVSYIIGTESRVGRLVQTLYSFSFDM